MFWGRFGLPIPREVPLRVVFGAPLTFTLSNGDADADASSSTGDAVAANPDGAGGGAAGGVGKRVMREVSDEELRKAHGEYVSALRRLFDDNKARFGYADRELTIL